MSDPHHQDKQQIVSNAVNDSEVPDTNPPQVFRSSEFFYPLRARIVHEGVNLPSEAKTVSVFQGQERSFRSGLQFDAIPDGAGVRGVFRGQGVPLPCPTE